MWPSRKDDSSRKVGSINMENSSGKDDPEAIPLGRPFNFQPFRKLVHLQTMIKAMVSIPGPNCVHNARERGWKSCGLLCM